MLKDHFLERAKAALTDRDQHIRSVASAYVTSMETGDVEGRLALFAVDGVIEDPVGSVPYVGHNAIRTFWTAGLAMTMRSRLEQVIVCGNEALIRFALTLSAAGAGDVTINPIDLITVDTEGKISNLRAFFDPGAIN